MRMFPKRLFLTALSGFFILIGASGVSGDTQGNADQATQLFVAQVKGKVLILRGTARHWAKPPEPLLVTDRVNTGKNSKAYLEFKEGGTVEVGPNSDMTVKQLETSGPDFKTRFLLSWGKFKAKVKHLETPNSSFEVEAGGVVAGVRGTVFGVEYDQAAKKVAAQTYEGSIFTRAGGKEQVVEKGYAMAVEKTGLSVKSPLTGQQMNSFKDFIDVSGQLEQKKQELMNQMRQKVMDKLPTGILPQKQEDDLKNTVGQHLPF
jgi:hypothetical protein